MDNEKTQTLTHDGMLGVSCRLDAFLAQHLNDCSRSYLQKLISSQCVTINELPAKKASQKIKTGDVITVSFPIHVPVEIKPEQVEFDIVDIQDDFLIVNKPAGLVVHHSKEGKEPVALVNGLLYRFKEFEAFDDNERPGIVHRIDKNTSGLLIVARTPQAQATLSQMFKDRKMHKEYLAVVKGHPDRSGKIDLPIGRHPRERHKMSHASYDGRDALTYYEVLAYYEDASLLKVHIITGRTHQVRVHCAAIGHGLLGDELYGVSSKLIKRQALHAWKLSFEYKGKTYQYSVPVPADLKKLLTHISS